MATGTIAPIGFGLESSPGVAAAATDWIPVQDGEGETDLKLQFPELIANSRQVNRYSLLGEQTTKGMLKFNLFSDMGIELVIGALATPAGAGTYIPTPLALPSFTIELQKGGIETFNILGAQVDKLKLTAAGGKQVEVNLDLIGLDYQPLSSPGTPAYTTTDPYNFSETQVSLSDYGTGQLIDTDVTHVEFTFDNHIIEQWTLQAATAAPKRIDAAKTTVTGKLTKYFGDVALYTAYRARTYQAIALQFARAGGPSVTFTVPKASMKTHKQPIKLGQFIVQEFDFTGVFDAVTGGILQIITS